MYLSGIHLGHIERGLPDPTLHLVCRGICRQQGDSRRVRLPITINLLCLLKEQLRTSTRYTPIEQRNACYGHCLHWPSMGSLEQANFYQILAGLTSLCLSTRYR